MKTQEKIDEINHKMMQLAKVSLWLSENADKLDSLPKCVLYQGSLGEQIDFDQLAHADVIRVVQALGGKWEKKINSAYADRVDYETKIGELAVRCWAGQPPPSCRLIEVEELIPEQHIPAHTIKRVKMVCQDEEPVATATANASAHDATEGQNE